MQAFYTACGSFIGQNYGAGKKDRIRRTFLISTAYAFGAGLLLGLGLLLFGRPFLSLFTTDPQVMDAGMYRLTVMSVSYCVSAFMDGSIAASRGLGKSAVPMVIVILGSCVFRIIWVYTVFAWFGTITSLYLLYVFSWTITGSGRDHLFHSYLPAGHSGSCRCLTAKPQKERRDQTIPPLRLSIK